MHTLPELKDKEFGGAWSVHDPETVQAVKRYTVPYQNVDVQKFLQDYAAWTIGGHDINGIKEYNYYSYSNGTTEAFDKFYQFHAGRRLRLWHGEYFYHQIQAREMFGKNFAWIDDGPIGVMDVVVVSAPFSDTGNTPENFDDVMLQCESLGVPVLIDMAYLNLTKNFNIDLSYKCIQTVTTSLSKVFPVETHRIGIRMNRSNIDDTLSAYSNNSFPYVNTTSVYVGQEMIKNYSNDWLYNKYIDLQKNYCKKLNVVPSDCVIFGIDYDNKFDQYNRGSNTNRLCFSKVWDQRN